MGRPGLEYPPPDERTARAGTTCAACGMPARKRVAIKKPGWRFAEQRDVCDECAKLVAELNGATPAPPAMQVLHVSPEPERINIVEELFHMSEPIVSPPSRPKLSCKEPGCTSGHAARGYCQRHYQAAKARGEFGAVAPRAKATKTAPRAKPEGLLSEELSPATLRPPRARPAAPAPKTPASSSARFVVRLGALVVECVEISDVVALHRALGAE